MNISKRVGKFKISGRVMQDEPDIVMEVMARCAILRCEHMAYGNYYEYCAISPDFDEVPMGEEIPEYLSTVIQNVRRLGKLTNDVRFRRIYKKTDTDAQRLRDIATKIETAA